LDKWGIPYSLCRLKREHYIVEHNPVGKAIESRRFSAERYSAVGGDPDGACSCRMRTIAEEVERV
jgi:hypothetical protein